MTVAEMIAALSAYPAEARVLVRGADMIGYVEAQLHGPRRVVAIEPKTLRADYDDASDDETALFEGLLVD